MKCFNLVVILLALTGSSAFAMPLIMCHNPATGASIIVSTYGESLNYSMNDALKTALDSQRGTEIAPQGMGGSFLGGDSYVLQFTPTDYFRLAPYEGGPGFMLSVFRANMGSENFYFNPGECSVAR